MSSAYVTHLQPASDAHCDQRVQGRVAHCFSNAVCTSVQCCLPLRPSHLRDWLQQHTQLFVCCLVCLLVCKQAL